MSNIASLATAPAGLRLLLMIADIADIARESGTRQVPTEAIIERGQEWGLRFSGFSDTIVELGRREWITYWASVGGVGEVVLTQAGDDVAAAFRDEQRDMRKRYRAVVDGLLAWVADYYYHVSGASPSIGDFTANDKGKYLGDTFTDHEIASACKRLKEEGLLSGTAVMGGLIPRPVITAAGLRLIESGRSVFDPTAPTGGTVTNINAQGAHGFNMAVNSPHATQTNTLTTEQVDRVGQTVEALRSILVNFGLPDGVNQEAEVLLGEIEQETASGAPHGSKIKDKLNAVGAAIGAAGLQVATTTANALIQQAMQGM